MAVDREGLREALAPVLANIWRAIECERHPYLYRGQLLADAALDPAGPLSNLLTKADSAERMKVERDEARATNRDLHRRTQKAERFRVRRGGSFIHLIKLRLAEGRARRAAQADVARLSAEVEALKAALRPFAEYARLSEEAGLDIGDGEIGEFIHRGFRRSIRSQDLRAARAALSRADKADSRERTDG